MKTNAEKNVTNKIKFLNLTKAQRNDILQGAAIGGVLMGYAGAMFKMMGSDLPSSSDFADTISEDAPVEIPEDALEVEAVIETVESTLDEGPIIESDYEISDNVGIEVEVDAEIPVVNEAVSFNDAFAQARAELGAGQFFEFEGRTYNTYYKEEWDAMQGSQQEEYVSVIADTISEDSVHEITILDDTISYDADDVIVEQTPEESSFDYDTTDSTPETGVEEIVETTIEETPSEIPASELDTVENIVEEGSIEEELPVEAGETSGAEVDMVEAKANIFDVADFQDEILDNAGTQLPNATQSYDMASDTIETVDASVFADKFFDGVQTPSTMPDDINAQLDEVLVDGAESPNLRFDDPLFDGTDVPSDSDMVSDEVHYASTTDSVDASIVATSFDDPLFDGTDTPSVPSSDIPVDAAEEVLASVDTPFTDPLFDGTDTPSVPSSDIPVDGAEEVLASIDTSFNDPLFDGGATPSVPASDIPLEGAEEVIASIDTSFTDPLFDGGATPSVPSSDISVDSIDEVIVEADSMLADDIADVTASIDDFQDDLFDEVADSPASTDTIAGDTSTIAFSDIEFNDPLFGDGPSELGDDIASDSLDLDDDVVE